MTDASTSLGHGTLNGESHPEIVHFDATQRRREKMRLKAQDHLKTEQQPAAPPVSVTPPAPIAAPAPPAAKPVPAPSMKPAPAPPQAQKPNLNGVGSLAAYTSAAPTPAPAAKTLSKKELETFLINFVVEQTGYPPEMVELDADLEADLGIDSIKKAQMMAELAEQFEIKVNVADGNLSLDDFPTLRHVVQLLESVNTTPTAAAPAAPEKKETVAPQSAPVVAQSAPIAAPSAPVATPSPAQTQPVAAPAHNREELETFLINFVVEQTGYPPEMVELDADLEADLGIDSIKKAQMMAELAEQFEIKVNVADGNLSLDDFPTLRHVVQLLDSTLSGTIATPAAAEAAPTAAPPVQPAPALETPARSQQAPAAVQPVEQTPSASQPAAAPAHNREELETFLINFVVEQTGYPPEMVELDADLEADLGIDSIKKAQMMAELAEQFQIKVNIADGNLSLDDFPTLRHVCDLLATVSGPV